jgi:dCTP deaminase
MSVLARSEIIREIDAGRIRVEPYDPTMIGPASIDLHLSNAFRLFVRMPKTVQVTNSIDFKQYTKGIWISDGETIRMQPGETLLGITKEKVTLPEDICGWLEGRSRFARIGLLIHISASFMQPGITNHQVLEMSNFGHLDLEISPNTAVCQFVFQRTVGTGEYRGIYQGQTPDNFWKD